MSPKLEKNQSPILVKFLMIHNNSPKKNHQNGWHFLVHKMSLNLEQNYSQNKVKNLVIQRICLQKCHQNWWKSDGITRICADFVENRDGIIYGKLARVSDTQWLVESWETALWVFSFSQLSRQYSLRLIFTIRINIRLPSSHHNRHCYMFHHYHLHLLMVMIILISALVVEIPLHLSCLCCHRLTWRRWWWISR